jgi:integrase/recombinase XerD
MRVLSDSDRIFDTQVDTKKIYVSMKYKFHPHNYVAKDGKTMLLLHVWPPQPAKKIPLDIYIDRKYWDFKKKRLSKGAADQETTNLLLDQIEAKITGIKVRFHLSEQVLTVESFIEEYKHGTPRLDFIEYFYHAKEKEFANKKIKYNTWKKEKSVHKWLKEFKPKILFSELKPRLLEDFIGWRKRQGNKMSTINSNLAIIKKYIGQAIEDGIKMPITHKQITVGSTDGNREALSEGELSKFISYYFSGFIRDNHKVPLARFLFSCFSSIRVGDNQNLNWNSFYEGNIMFDAEKTEKSNRIKINKTAMLILNHCPEIFSATLTDQHVNRKLQEAADFLGIRTHVTFHISRHTFATNFLEDGGSIEVLNKILDHQSLETTKIYVHVSKSQQHKQIMLLDDTWLQKALTFSGNQPPLVI